MVAPSLQTAIDEPGYKFYLDTPFETADIRTEFKKLRNKCGGALDNMLINDHARMFYMCKCVAPVGSSQYRRGGPNYTPPDQMYDDLDNYINGKTLEADTRITVRKFLEFYEMGIDELTRRAVVKDATELHLIEPRGDGRLYYIKDNAALGKNIEEMLVYLDNALNESTWSSLRDTVEYEWRT